MPNHIRIPPVNNVKKFALNNKEGSSASAPMWKHLWLPTCQSILEDKPGALCVKDPATCAVMPSRLSFSSLRARVNITYMASHQSSSSKPAARGNLHPKVETATESLQSSPSPRLSSTQFWNRHASVPQRTMAWHHLCNQPHFQVVLPMSPAEHLPLAKTFVWKLSPRYA